MNEATTSLTRAGQQAEPLAGQMLPIHFVVERIGDNQAVAQVIEKSSFLVPR